MAMTKRPRLLIEEWLPAAAIGVECTRERSTGQQPPDKRFHIWWARRPLAVSRAAVLGSLLPVDFSRDVFECLLGFWGTSKQLIAAQDYLKYAKEAQLRGTMSHRVKNPHGKRAFQNTIQQKHYDNALLASQRFWGEKPIVMDPMAGGGSIPLEARRLGFNTLANEYNPVACLVLEATIDYPFRFGENLTNKARSWARVLLKSFRNRMEQFYPDYGLLVPHCYIFSRTVPCPDTGNMTPLVPDWHLLKPKSTNKPRLVAEPIVDINNGTWTVRFREIGQSVGRLRQPPKPSYSNGKGVSIFTNRPISAEYIKAMALQGRMKSVLYVIAIKTPQGLKFQLPGKGDLDALEAAEKELAKLQPRWEKNNIIPTEKVPVGDKTGDPSKPSRGNDLPLKRGETHWTKMFTSRQLLCMGVLVEELRKLKAEIVKVEGDELGEAIVHLLAFCIDKFANFNCHSSSWAANTSAIRGHFDRHDYAFKLTFAEMAPCNAGSGLSWAIDNVLRAYQKICELPRNESAKPVEICLGSATNLPQFADKSITAVVVDPPYADNVQYSELADFFYVWLKRTQGHRRPDWFSTYLCDNSQEAVVNVSRHRINEEPAKDVRRRAHVFYQKLMAETFQECHRVLRDDGVLTVMFTHKKQEAWEALFTSLIQAGFTITATWPVKTESEHSLHQAKKNAAQSTVILVSRKRFENAGIGYFDSAMREEIRQAARNAAARLEGEGLNRVDQLVGSFGPAIEVYSRYDEVRTDTGKPVGVDKAIDEASDSVSTWRIEQLAERGLEGVEPEGRFALLCWDVLGAAEFRFNEAKLLGHAVGMDVDQLIVAGLVEKSGDKIKILPAKQRRRERALEPDEIQETLFGAVKVPKKRKKKDVLKIHPNDPAFRTALDACHALALRYTEAGGESAGIGSAKSLARQQQWSKDSPVARLMEALVKAAPVAVQYEKGKTSAAAIFPEFRAWHAMLKPLFEIEPLEWKEQAPLQKELFEEQEQAELIEGEDESDSSS